MTMGRIHHLVLLLLVFQLISSCSSIRPNITEKDRILLQEHQQFNYTGYGNMLRSRVDDQGLVDYSGLHTHPESLDRFYAQLSLTSPDTNALLFPSRQDKLAYWINAYNASVLKGVVANYPITSVEEVKGPPLLFFFPSKSGFFLFQRFTYGGVETSLYYLENKIIRGRFQEPRIHFALNCASLSCPKLPQTPFLPDTLDSQLEDEARKFINDPTRVQYNPETNTLYLSAIFKWYTSDFTNFLKTEHEISNATLLDYIKIYLNQDIQEMIEKNGGKPYIRYLPYNWGLNDQNSSS